ncbi:MAG: LysM peptidoglycan-binding domain-containing protein [Lentisphaeria bacterium]|nr:LysM peptidoglycan-binding domain-containing protein [Lentisphaeria bacterium]
MSIRKITLCLTAVAAAGCVYAQQGNNARTSFRTPQDAVRYYEDLVGRLAQQVRSMQDENAMLSASGTELKQRVARLEADVRSLSGELAALRKQIAADAEVRKDQLNRLADKLTETPKVEKNIPPRKPEPAGNTEFVEHVVEKGTTLNALAKAYGVTVKEIMNANKLKKPVIYAGQKLLIPAVSKKP